MPIALKFAASIALLTLLLMSFLTVKAIQIAGRTQDVLTNDKGLLALHLLAARLDASWLTQADAQGALQDALVRCLRDSAPSGVRDLLVYNAAGEVLASARGSQSIKVTSPRRIAYAPAESSGAAIEEFDYDSAGVSEPIRSFQKPIRGPLEGGAALLGRAQILLSAEHIRAERARVRDAMVALSAVSALVAAAASFLLATILSRPIRVLSKDLRQVSLGDLDHRSAVRSADEIGLLARNFNAMVEHVREAQELRLAQKAVEHELELAHRIQSRLLPERVPELPGLDIAAYYLPAREVGGDYYDFIPIDDERWGLAIADVAGKGVPASLVMTMTRSLLRLAAAGCASPAEALAAVNRILGPDLNPGMFVSLLYLIVHVPTFTVRMARAGHNGPLFFSARSQRAGELRPRGIAIGIDRGGGLFERELEVQQFVLQPGDAVVLYTDGITEAKDPDGAEYSLDRLRELVLGGAGRGAQEIVDAVLADLEEHRREAERSDDSTLIVVRRRPPR